MKENNYDNPGFFSQYRRFPRSVEGLSAAGEWHALQKLFPDFSGKRVPTTWELMVKTMPLT